MLSTPSLWIGAKFWFRIYALLSCIKHTALKYDLVTEKQKPPTEVVSKLSSRLLGEEGWMKEDLFVRPDGRPMIFLMGEVRERDKVLNFWIYLG